MNMSTMAMSGRSCVALIEGKKKMALANVRGYVA